MVNKVSSSLSAFVVFFLALCLSSRFASVVGSITFVGSSSREDLVPKGLPPEWAVEDIHDVIKRTSIYKSHYNASVLGYETGRKGSETETKPDIFMVHGSPVPSDDDSSSTWTQSSPFGFISAALAAYGYHADLTIRPDDIWITILSQFSFYVNARAEKLRKKFVNFDGKKELRVDAIGTIETVPYDLMTIEFLDKISENIVDPSLKEWFSPGFSTTTTTDEVVAAATAMCTFQEYFKYTFGILCGIPHVRLEGSVGDWEKLRSKVERLAEFDDGSSVLLKWLKLLRYVTDNFVESARNGSENNLAFWDNIVYLNSFGCGALDYSGWISAFTYFDSEGQPLDESWGDETIATDSNSDEFVDAQQTFPIIDPDQVNANVLSCPATVDDNGVEYSATLFVGQMTFSYGPSDAEMKRKRLGGVRMAIQPRNDWALVIESGSNVQQARLGPEEAGIPSLSFLEHCYIDSIPEDGAEP